MAFAVPKPIKPIFDFAVQVAVGAIGFVVAFSAAVALSVIVTACEGFTPVWMQAIALLAEKALLAVDLFCFCLFLLSEVLKLARGLWNEWKI